MNDVVYPDPTAARAADATRRERFLDDPRRKSPVLAAVLSAFPGLGQVYVGYYRQGFVHIGAIAAMIGLLASNTLDEAMAPPIGFLLAFVWLYNIIDAARRASLYNQALVGLHPMELPDDVKAPQTIGSFGGGVALIVIGLVLFSNTMFGWSLRWLSDWWPMALVAAGAWLVYEDWRTRREPPAA